MLAEPAWLVLLPEPSTWMCTARRARDLLEKESVVATTVSTMGVDSWTGVETSKSVTSARGEDGAAAGVGVEMGTAAGGGAAVGVGGARRGSETGGGTGEMARVMATDASQLSMTGAEM